MNKSALIATLYKWIAQRPGLDFADYGDVSAYRSESRSIICASVLWCLSRNLRPLGLTGRKGKKC